MTTRTQLAYAAAGVVLLLGLLGLFNPGLAARFLGLDIAAPRGLSEVRATYGALHVTMAALLLWAIPLRPGASGTVRAMGLLWLGAAAGRLASMAIDAVATPGNLGLVVIQLIVGGALVWAGLETPLTAAEARSRREAAAARKRLASARKRAAAGTAPGTAPAAPDSMIDRAGVPTAAPRGPGGGPAGSPGGGPAGSPGGGPAGSPGGGRAGTGGGRDGA